MKTRLLTALRILRGLVSLVIVLLVLATVAASVAGYLAATGKSLPLLRAITTRAGRLIVGQRIDDVSIEAQLIPEHGRLVSTATLTVHSLEERRQRFYFLLNPALQLQTVRLGAEGHRPVAAYQLWMLVVVDLDAPLDKDATVQLRFEYEGAPAAKALVAGSTMLNARQVLLPVDSLWFPTDTQSFFNAEATITLPADLTVVHNGTDYERIERGGVQQVHWRSQRPVPGLSLVAGPYTLTTAERGAASYRIYLPRDVVLDPARILEMMSTANDTLSERYGPSGFSSVTLFVSRDLRRAFNDGSGLLGMSIRYFRAGDYGFAIVAHEVAHNWWGSTVAEHWLAPGTGGEWLVEGFAEFSSLVATEAASGPEALTRRMASEFFDPARQAAVSDMSVLDNALAEATARDTIYRKGAYVAMMLRRSLGDELCFRALREFLARFRYQHATDRDLQQVLQEISQQDLEPFFSDWVRSNKLADLSLDGSNQAEVTVNNLGAAAISGPIDLWAFKKNGGEPVRSTVHVGDKIPLPADTDYVVLDPLLSWADVQRQNNRYPRRSDPIYVAASPRGTIVITNGDLYPWVRATISNLDGSGHTQHTWEFNRGVMEPPTWSADESRIIVSYADADQPLPSVVTLATDGPQRTIGQGTAPAAASDAMVYAAKQERIVRINAGVKPGAPGRTIESTIVYRPGQVLDLPLPSPDGTQLVYTAASGNHLELRRVDRDGQHDRFITSWDRDRMVYRWANDGKHLYAVVGGEWDWQIWDIPLDAGAVRVLVRDAVAIGDLGLSADGAQLAFTAAPEFDYPRNRRQLYVMHLNDRSVQRIDIAAADLSSVAWVNADSLLVVATSLGPDQPWMLPLQRSLKRVHVKDGRVEDMP